MNRNKTTKFKKSNIKATILTIFLLLLFVATVGGTISYLVDKTGTVTNTFTPADLEITPDEKVEGMQKSNITFTNASNVSVFVRSTLEIYWTDTIDGSEQRIAAPAGAKVTLDDTLGKDWFKVGEVYYYSKALNPSTATSGKQTSVMLTNPITVSNPSNTATCHINVHCEAIQAEPEYVVEEAWKVVKVNETNGELVPATTN